MHDKQVRSQLDAFNIGAFKIINWNDNNFMFKNDFLK